MQIEPIRRNRSIQVAVLAAWMISSRVLETSYLDQSWQAGPS